MNQLKSRFDNVCCGNLSCMIDDFTLEISINGLNYVK